MIYHAVRHSPVRLCDVGQPMFRFDIFLSHASEDKETFARPLAEQLQAAGLRVWFDEFTLTVGDGLRRSIDRGLEAV